MGQQVAVVGAGLMGAGIAQVAAVHGYDVVLRDVTTEALDRGTATIRASYAKFTERGRMTQDDADAALARITTTTDLDAAGSADLVVEAVFEKLEVKAEVFRALDRICKPTAVLASNTSAIPITSIAAVTERPESVVGAHFFSPVPMMRLCEVVRGYKTSDETVAAARAFAEGVGKTVIVVNRDVAGFVTTRLISALAMEAVRLLESGVASAEDIDTACRLGFGHAMGPLETIDLTGVDIMLNAAGNIYTDTQDETFAPPELLRGWWLRATSAARAAVGSMTTPDPRTVMSGRDKPWLMRTYAGHSSASASNALYRTNLEKGQTGLSVAFDLPTQTATTPTTCSPAARSARSACRWPTSVTCVRCSTASRSTHEHLDDHQRHGDVAPLALRRRGRGAGRRAVVARRHDPERHHQGVPVAGYLRVPSRAVAAPDHRRDRLDGGATSRSGTPSTSAATTCRKPVPRRSRRSRTRCAPRSPCSTPSATRARCRRTGSRTSSARISFFVNAGVRFVDEMCKMRAFVQLWDELTQSTLRRRRPKARAGSATESR